MDASARDFDIELKELPERIEEMRSDVQTLEALLEREREQLAEATKLRAQQVDELKNRTDGLAKAKAKAAKARNLKEADAAEREVDANRRAIREREEEITRLEEAIERKSTSLATREEQFKEAHGNLKEEETKATARLAIVNAERSKVLKGREDVVEKIDKMTMKRYERFKKSKGTAVVFVKDRTCSKCRMSLPAQLYIEVTRAETLTRCPQCQTIIIHEDVMRDPNEEAGEASTEEVAPEASA